MASSSLPTTKVVSGHSGFHAYSPISTLERQYAGSPRVFLFVKINANCCFPGGVEAILKVKNNALSTLSTQRDGSYEENSRERTGSDYSDPNANWDPFSFLSDHSEDASANGSALADGSTAANKKGPNLGRFLKKVAKSTTQSLERGFHNIAIRADQGRNADLMVLGLYDEQDGLLHMTESQPLPDDHARLSGVRFLVPLILPAHVDGNNRVVIKLWIRSGAAFLQGTKSARSYLIGSVHLSAARLRSIGTPGAFFDCNVQSTLVADGHLNICVVPDLKFSPLGGRGWSLADPDANTAYQSHSSLFNLPLDMSYGFTFPPRPHACLVASERAVESTVVLPIAAAFATLASQAAQVSLHHAVTVRDRVFYIRHDSAVGEYADVNVGIGVLQTDPEMLAHTTPFVSASWQRADSIFDVELLHPTKVPTASSQPTDFRPAIAFRFFPKPSRTRILPALLHANGGRLPNCGFMLGSLRLLIVIPKPRSTNGTIPENSYGGPASSLAPPDQEVWECMISLDSHVLQASGGNSVSLYPVHHVPSRRVMGTICLSLSLQMQQGPTVPTEAIPARGGLVSLVGMDAMMDHVSPSLDFDPQPTSLEPAFQRREQQLATMGVFATHAYVDQHVKNTRSTDVLIIQERANQYQAALTMKRSGKKPPTHEDRSPKPFRPSSSRPEILLSGIPFNCHTATLALNLTDPEQPRDSNMTGALFYDVTCGAPADHARGFGNVFPSKKDTTTFVNTGLTSPIGIVTGGLRRIESRRQELAKLVYDLQTTLTMNVQNYFGKERQQKNFVNHVTSSCSELQDLRWQLFEAIQALHHITWHCAVRRASVFPQALGLAVTSYMASLSDSNKYQSTWPDAWAQHGYLVSFEGLLSAAGKELGMIEDASVGIGMLNRVQIQIQSDDGSSNKDRTPVPHSPYLKWLTFSAIGDGARTEYVLKLGVLPSYFNERIPNSLKGGTMVRLYPLLFEVGVDIRQWGANTGSSVKSQISSRSTHSTFAPEEMTKEPTGGLLDEEDDDVGVSDDDVLVQLNYEAFQKMNTYAFSIFPVSAEQGGQPRTHPQLETLYQHIVSSAGKMNHDILDEAASLSKQLGGGGVVFCKSGKDRTAMHITYKQAQFACQFRQRHPLPDQNASLPDTTLADAMIMRVYGTRLPICEKNVGQSKYAFNSLQVKFMPDALKPPMNTLAGFLKGGKVFAGGGIES
jgi:hypothetical protein